jgi:hypothetical protein
MVHTQYGRFDLDSFHRGMVLNLLKSSQHKVYDAMVKMEQLGYDKSNIPDELLAELEKIDALFEEAKEHFGNMNYFDKDKRDAFDTAFEASTSSKQLLTIVDQLPGPSTATQEVKPIEEEKEQKGEEKAEFIEDISKVEANEGQQVSFAIKSKKKVTLVAVKNSGDEQIYRVQIGMEDGSIRFAKARGWDRDRIDQSTVILQTVDNPLKTGQSLICVLIVNNQNSSFDWSAFDSHGNVIVQGNSRPR